MKPDPQPAGSAQPQSSGERQPIPVAVLRFDGQGASLPGPKSYGTSITSGKDGYAIVFKPWRRYFHVTYTPSDPAKRREWRNYHETKPASWDPVSEE